MNNNIQNEIRDPEIWKKICLRDEFKNLTQYSVSNYGRVRNDNTGQILKLSYDKDGYLKINLQHSDINLNIKEKKTIRINVLVALLFIENNNPEIKNQVNHINEIRDDNYYKNLEWVDCKTNINNGSHNDNVANTRNGRKISNKTRLKIVESQTGKNYPNRAPTQNKEVIQLDLDGNVIREYKSVASTKEYGFKSNSVGKCCRGKIKTYKGFIFKFKDDKITKRKFKNIVQLSINNEFIMVYKSTKEIESAGFNISIIRAACKRERHLSSGFKWMYEDDYNKVIKNDKNN